MLILIVKSFGSTNKGVDRVHNLNQHKFLSHLSDGSGCPCEDDVEDNFHYFYVCPLCHRILLFTQLRNLAYFLNIDVLLKGSPDLSFDDNIICCIFLYPRQNRGEGHPLTDILDLICFLNISLLC
jgi:hypothetical protein